MHRDKLKYLLISIGLFIVLIMVLHYTEKPLDWRMTFDYRHKAPYGCYVLEDILYELFDDSIVNNYKTPYFNPLIDNAVNNNLFIVSNRFDPGEVEAEELFDFVESGNRVFISAKNIPGEFLEKLNLSLTTEIMDTSFWAERKPKMNFFNPLLNKEEGYESPKSFMNVYFRTEESFRGKVLGYGSSGKLNFIECKWGEGKFFLHSQPLVFTNIRILYRDSDYVRNALLYIPEGKLIIDNYYKPYRAVNNSPTKFVLSHASLRTAYYLLLFTLLVYMVFGSRRKQRAIPVFEPLKNTSADFIRTVSRLYFKSENHASIARKKSVYFKEFLRERYYITDISIEERDVALIHLKTGVKEPLVRRIIRKVLYFEKQARVSKEALMSFHEDIEEFRSICL